MVDNKCIYEHRQNSEFLYTTSVKVSNKHFECITNTMITFVEYNQKMICESHFTYNLNDDIESCFMMTSLEQNGGFYLVSIQSSYSFKKCYFCNKSKGHYICGQYSLYLHKDDDKKRKRNICIAIHFQKNNRH